MASLNRNKDSIVRLRLRLTRRGWALCVVGASGTILSAVLGRSEVLVGGVVLLVAPLIALLTLAVSRPNLAIHRLLITDMPAAGDSIVSTIRIHNLADHPSAAANWRETVTTGFRPTPIAELPSLDRRRLGESFGPDCAEFRMELHAKRRGPGAIGPLVLTRPDPFGFATAEYSVGAIQPMLVTPRVTPLPGSRFDVGSGEWSEPELQRATAPSADELIARPYQPGDSLRRVHWRATAKQDALMVRQEEQRSTPRAVIYFDARSAIDSAVEPTAGTAVGPPVSAAGDGFETAVELVASITVLLLDENFDLALVHNGVVRNGSRTGPPVERAESAIPRSPEVVTPHHRYLSELARIAPDARTADDRLDELDTALHYGVASVPLFAVFSTADSRTAERLAALGGVSDPAVAFVFEGRGAPRAAAILRASGWRCVIVGVAESPDSAWTRAMYTSTSDPVRGADRG